MAYDISVAWQFSQREQLVFHCGSISVPGDEQTFWKALDEILKLIGRALSLLL
jgi:hypothetical protein